MEKYAKPPIIDATIEARFEPRLPEKLMRRFIEKAKTRYAQIDEQVEMQFTFGADTPQSFSQEFAGARFLSADGTELLVISKNSLAVSCYPPYAGWSALKARADAELEHLRTLAPDRRFVRLGVRYINRIDVPMVDAQFSPEPYFTFYPKRPDILKGKPAMGYSVTLDGCAVGDYLVNVNTGIGAPQLINHGAIMIDVDAYIEADMDFRTLGERLESVRAVKNSVFEGLITDRARQLFQ